MSFEPRDFLLHVLVEAVNRVTTESDWHVHVTPFGIHLLAGRLQERRTARSAAQAFWLSADGARFFVTLHDDGGNVRTGIGFDESANYSLEGTFRINLVSRAAACGNGIFAAAGGFA